MHPPVQGPGRTRRRSASARTGAAAAWLLASLVPVCALAQAAQDDGDVAAVVQAAVADATGAAAAWPAPSGAGWSDERVVKGAPYCAEALHETVQWLADGNGGAPNRIVRQQTTQLCRDGEGRTRQEVDRGGRKRVYLRDPVAREAWVLDPAHKTARRLAGTAALPADAEPDGWNDYAARMRAWARQMADSVRSLAGSGRTGRPTAADPVPPAAPAPPMPPTPPEPVVITRPDGVTGDVEVNVVRLHGPAAASEWPQPPMAVQWRAQGSAPRGAGAVSPLGSRDVDGVHAQGERTTWVIEAGTVGNDKPIQITREVWTAPELMVTLSSRDFDPRSGEVNYRLRGLRRGEPDPALMRVPADYARAGSAVPPVPKAPAAPRTPSAPTG